MKAQLGRVAVLAGVMVLAVACSDDGAPQTQFDDPQLTLGEQVYADRCAVCHGRDGGGGIGPKVGSGAVVESLPDIGAHRAVVAGGRGTMPAWENVLSDEEIDAVVRYQREELGR